MRPSVTIGMDARREDSEAGAACRAGDHEAVGALDPVVELADGATPRRPKVGAGCNYTPTESGGQAKGAGLIDRELARKNWLLYRAKMMLTGCVHHPAGHMISGTAWAPQPPDGPSMRAPPAQSHPQRRSLAKA